MHTSCMHACMRNCDSWKLDGWEIVFLANIIYQSEKSAIYSKWMKANFGESIIECKLEKEEEETISSFYINTAFTLHNPNDTLIEI